GNSFTYDSKSDLVHDSLNIFNPPPQPPLYSCEFCGNDARKEPDNSLSMGDEHPDTIPATKSDEFIQSSVENLVTNPSEPEGEYELSEENLFEPLFDEEIISMKIDSHHFNAESDLIESLLNHDSSIISSSSKIDSLFDEFAGELTLLKPIPPRINETNCDPENEYRFIKRLFDSLMEEIDLSFSSDYPMPSGIEEDDYDSERDILILEELLSNDSLSLPENESFHFDISSSSRPPAKLPDGYEAFQPSFECSMMIYGRNTPILDVPLSHFYPP
nr:hypothetical protein [Tanacetum cinerariifolium]